MNKQFIQFLNIRYAVKTRKVSQQYLVNNIILNVLPRITAKWFPKKQLPDNRQN